MSKNKYVDESDEFFIDEPKSKSNTAGTLRQDFELFDEDSYIPQEIISVKRIPLPNNGESWEVVQNEKTIFTLKGIRFTKKEKEFLRKPEGIMLIINGFKEGWRTTAEFKRQVKKCL